MSGCPPLRLAVRTPEGLVFDGTVAAIRAEDLDGGFGILPGRRDLAAVLPPGLVLFTDDDGDGYVAVSGGVLELIGGRCRVVAGEAELARDPEEAARALRSVHESRASRAARHTGVLEDLEREALHRLATALKQDAR